MSSGASADHRFHPELKARARLLPRGLVRRWNLRLIKRLTRWAAARNKAATEVQLDGCGAYVYRPRKKPAAPAPALLWIHGGGLLVGDARQDEAFLCDIADELGISIASAQYRCAPEHPFPTPLEDCKQAYDWLAAQPDVDASRIMVGGASAGGGLAAALCQLCRDRGEPLPSFQLLVYPMLDDRSADRPDPRDSMFRIWDRPANALGWGSYLRGHSRTAPPTLAVPARAANFSRLPPAWIGVGTLDLFLDEDLAYAKHLEAAGVEVETELVDGAYHGFELADPRQRVSRTFTAAKVSALRRHLAAGDSPRPQPG